MEVKYGNGKTEYGPGIDILLDGDELAIAIMEYIERQGVAIFGARTVSVNRERCQQARIYVDPSGSVNYSGQEFSGRGPKKTPELETDRSAELTKIFDALTGPEIVEEIYNAMRFEREGSTPVFKNGNAYAEMRARSAAYRIAEIIGDKINAKT